MLCCAACCCCCCCCTAAVVAAVAAAAVKLLLLSLLLAAADADDGDVAEKSSAAAAAAAVVVFTGCGLAVESQPLHVYCCRKRTIRSGLLLLFCFFFFCGDWRCSPPASGLPFLNTRAVCGACSAGRMQEPGGYYVNTRGAYYDIPGIPGTIYC